MAIIFTGTEPQTEPLTMEKMKQTMELVSKFMAAIPHQPAPSGFKIVENSYLFDSLSLQTKFPRSRKKRIQKKFKKLWTHTFAKPKQNYFIIKDQGIIVCHPEIAKRLRASIEEMERKEDDYRVHMLNPKIFPTVT